MSHREQVVAVFSKPHPDAAFVLRRVAQHLTRHGARLVPDPQTASVLHLGEGLAREQAVDGADMVISVGGDGTLLATARAIGPRGIPILGVNLGNLGFLTETRCDEVDDVVDAALKGRAPIETRPALGVTLNDEPVTPGRTALNDVVLSSGDLARLFALSLWVDGEWVTDYRADGLILATPTGSTAYSLSAGGPIVTPKVDALVVTPICPHSLSQRPLLLPGGATVEVALAEAPPVDVPVRVTLDGQVGFGLGAGDRLTVSRAAWDVRLIRPAGRSFFPVLRDKLRWGH